MQQEFGKRLRRLESKSTLQPIGNKNQAAKLLCSCRKEVKTYFENLQHLYSYVGF